MARVTNKENDILVIQTVLLTCFYNVLWICGLYVQVYS